MAAVAGLAAAAEPVIVRQGGWWVGTVTGSEAIPPGSALLIGGRGAVVLNGGAEDRVAWRLEARVKAADMAAARNRLRQMAVKTAEGAGALHLTVDTGQLLGSLRLAAPRGLREVRVGLGEGGVEVNGVQGAVAIATGGGDVRADRIGGDFAARTAGGEIRLGEMGGAVRCTTGGGAIQVRRVRGDASLETGGGDIDAGEIGGAARCSTGGGAVRLARVGAGAIVTTGGGPVNVGEARGLVEIRNSGGPVRVGAAGGVRCEAAAGGIVLESVSGSLRASTSIGSIVARLIARSAAGDSFLTTGRGDITVVIPSNVGVKIRAESEMPGGGRSIVSDFPGLLTRVAGGRVFAEGDVNGGGPLLMISSSGGNIFIRRR